MSETLSKKAPWSKKRKGYRRALEYADRKVAQQNPKYGSSGAAVPQFSTDEIWFTTSCWARSPESVAGLSFDEGVSTDCGLLKEIVETSVLKNSLQQLGELYRPNCIRKSNKFEVQTVRSLERELNRLQEVFNRANRRTMSNTSAFRNMIAHWSHAQDLLRNACEYSDWSKHLSLLSNPKHTNSVVESGEIARGSWTQSSSQILARLEQDSTSNEEQWKAVLFAETTTFQTAEVPRLLAALARFIGNNRFTTDGGLTIVVAAAIRKYAMNMSEERFESYADWLQPSQTDTVSYPIELELTKGAAWRLMYLPIAAGKEFRHVREILSELCKVYLRPRLILQENFASTALHGIVAVTMLDAHAGIPDPAEDLLRRSKQIQVRWFSELLEDRTREAAKALDKHSPQLAERLRKCLRLQ
ncbi:MAG: hypothetical protein SGJ20_21430 [Planctomycetota bacterium]|nr:hypothetical protein [Planctomycetota bacterium]